MLLVNSSAIPVSLITTVYNEASNIESFLDSYAKQSIRPTEFIIVDGGSTDHTVQLIMNRASSDPGLNIKLIIDVKCNRRYCSAPIAKGRNIAINHASSDWIIVTDAGCFLPPNWLSEMYSSICKNEYDVISGWYEPLNLDYFQSLYASAALLKISQINPDTFLPSSRNIAFKKIAWEKVSGYPEITFTAEDTLFDLLLKQSGFNFYFNANSVVFWDCPHSLKEACFKQFRYGEGDGYLLLFPKNAFLGFVKILIPVGSILLFCKPKIATLKYLLLLANQLGYLNGILKRFLYEKYTNSFCK